MPIPVLAEIERWIIEHASSAVLKDHLAFLNAKFALLKEDSRSTDGRIWVVAATAAWRHSRSPAAASRGLPDRRDRPIMVTSRRT